MLKQNKNGLKVENLGSYSATNKEWQLHPKALAKDYNSEFPVTKYLLKCHQKRNLELFIIHATHLNSQIW